jgi:hypothetical protein
MAKQLSLIPTPYLQSIRKLRAPLWAVCPMCQTVYDPGKGRATGCSLRCCLQVRFWRKVEKTDTCWLWQGATSRGYGTLTGNKAVHKQTWYAHRLAYEWFVGPIPEGLRIDHLCRNTRCVNPEHMEPVTGGENSLRGDGFGGLNSRKTHCEHGHPFDEENTYRKPNGWRGCRRCTRRSGNEKYARAMEAQGRKVRPIRRRKPSG